MRRLDVAIVGAGPAGLSTALLLARAGHRVVLFERFDQAAPVGSGLMLQATGLAVLGRLGLRPRMEGLGRRIERLLGRTVTGRGVLDVRFAAAGRELHGLAVHRAGLFNVLHDAVVDEGIVVETASPVDGFEPLSDARGRLSVGRRSAGPFDLVVDASGARSALKDHAAVPVSRKALGYGALWATVPWPVGGPFDGSVLEQRYRGARVMIGVLPVGRQIEGGPELGTFFWSLPTASYGAWRSAGLAAWRAEAAALWPDTAGLVETIRHLDDMVLAAYGHHTLPLPVGRGIAFVGDSAHSTSPQLGQGANMALLDAAALAHAIEISADVPTALARYARLRRWHVRSYQAMSAAFTPLYQSDARLLPALRDLVFPVLPHLPLVPAFLARLVAGLLVDPLGPLGLPDR